MSKARALCVVLCAFLVTVLHCDVIAPVSAQGSNTTSRWKTLSGDPPFVVARGGFSGLFPYASSVAFGLALMTSVPDTILWCDVQLTKDAAGICFPDLMLENDSNIANVIQRNKTKYLVNGVPTQGYFAIDFTLRELSNVGLTQAVLSRTNKFDGNGFPIPTVEDVVRENKPPGLWLNIQNDAFYTQHNLSMRSFVIAVSRRVAVSYISSPEVNFVRSIQSRFRRSRTKLVFRFLGQTQIEPSTNQTYGSLLRNLTFIGSFASGILVPKNYIWPVDASLYLQAHTSLVSDAHKEGLKVFAADFANDIPFAYNYSYDPVAEYLQFVDNGDFSVDGVVTDFPITPSEAFDCSAHLGRNATKQVELLVISKNGASGDYPRCTDLAYQAAIADGADVIDCPVQMSQDGVPFCFSSINLIDGTTIVQTNYSGLTLNIPELSANDAIYPFNMTWDQIASLTPAISIAFPDYKLLRNPKFRNAGKLVRLSDFLDMARNASSLTGVLISIEHAAYLAQHQGLSVIDAVNDALADAGFNNQTALKVMIQSTNSSVLSRFRNRKNYERVYKVDETISGALNATIGDIKRIADSVVINKASVFPMNEAFIISVADVVPRLKAFKLPVYVETFSNEFVSQAWDFFSDSTVEINSFYMGAGINGVITDFPKTSSRYRRNRCLNLGKDTPPYMSPVQPASLLQLITPDAMPPAEAPNPVLTVADVSEPPFPPVADRNPARTGDGGTAAPTAPNGQPKLASCFFLSSLAMLLATLLLL